MPSLSMVIGSGLMLIEEVPVNEWKFSIDLDVDIPLKMFFLGWCTLHLGVDIPLKMKGLSSLVGIKLSHCRR